MNAIRWDMIHMFEENFQETKGQLEDLLIWKTTPFGKKRILGQLFLALCGKEESGFNKAKLPYKKLGAFSYFKIMLSVFDV